MPTRAEKNEPVKLLIVEDEESLATALQGLFEPIVDSCETVPTFTDALAVMQKKRFEIVTLDLNLPDSRSQHTLSRIQEIKRANPDAIVIVFTGLSSPELEREAIRCGADGFLTKATAVDAKGGFLASFRAVLQNLLTQPIRYRQSINLLDRLVSKISAQSQPSNPNPV